jgi:GH15 family glucan-1,4-alpha-glucosidase
LSQLDRAAHSGGALSLTDANAAVRTEGVLPLEQYGVISDGRTIALVGADAGIDWWCVPALDSPPVFDRLVTGEDGARFSLLPLEPFTAERTYREGSNVLETTFATERGAVRVTDSLNSGHAGRLPWSELARRIEGLRGEVPMRVELQLGSRFGASEPACNVTPNDGAFQLGPLLMQLRTTDDCAVDEAAGESAGRCSLEVHASAGSRSTIALLATSEQPLMDSDIRDIDVRIDRSDQQWKDWTDDLRYDGPYRERVLRSALALKLLLFSPTGAIAAAATTSLPEKIGSEKNYDYRFAWLRDVAYSTKALLRIGGVEEAQAAFAWMMETIERHGPEPRAFYTLAGELPPTATDSGAGGYHGSRPVRVGNDARDQLQLSVYGDVLETAELFTRTGNHLDARTREVLTSLTDQCAARWREPDAGLWELEDEQHYTMSKIGCWLALDRAAKLAADGHLDSERAAGWATIANDILDWIDEHCWSERRSAYVQYAGCEALDAALLLATRFGMPRKERLESTRVAIQDELAVGALVYRYSGMPDEEGAFLATSFWLVEALAFLGHPDEARATMDELLEVTSGDLGLMSEMVDPETHAFLGNLPQGLSHLALIHAALAIQELDEAGDD